MGCHSPLYQLLAKPIPETMASHLNAQALCDKMYSKTNLTFQQTHSSAATLSYTNNTSVKDNHPSKNSKWLSLVSPVSDAPPPAGDPGEETCVGAAVPRLPELRADSVSLSLPSITITASAFLRDDESCNFCETNHNDR
ncbi:hypothetical protein Bbelb_179280 [Branchiostoma belcheri]|nr:hypothetical protein Bbelb_179280 [Branchiostoma belcheri]